MRSIERVGGKWKKKDCSKKSARTASAMQRKKKGKLYSDEHKSQLYKGLLRRYWWVLPVRWWNSVDGGGIAGRTTIVSGKRRIESTRSANAGPDMYADGGAQKRKRTSTDDVFVFVMMVLLTARCNKPKTFHFESVCLFIRTRTNVFVSLWTLMARCPCARWTTSSPFHF